MIGQHKNITLFDILKLEKQKIIEIVRSYLFKNGVRCPYCNSYKVVKFGKLRSDHMLQRYYCKTCGKTFNELSGTPLEGVHNIRENILVAYFKLELKCSDYAISKALGIPYSTVREISKRIIENTKFFKSIFQMLQKEQNSQN